MSHAYDTSKGGGDLRKTRLAPPITSRRPSRERPSFASIHGPDHPFIRVYVVLEAEGLILAVSPPRVLDIPLPACIVQYLVNQPSDPSVSWMRSLQITLAWAWVEQNARPADRTSTESSVSRCPSAVAKLPFAATMVVSDSQTDHDEEEANPSRKGAKRASAGRAVPSLDFHGGELT